MHPLQESPANTILPSDWMPRAWALSTEEVPISVVTVPVPPKVVSRVPFEVYLTRAKSLSLPISDRPATTILPSDWMPRAWAISQ